MGFPLCYSELLLPKPIIQILVFVRFLQRLISSSFTAIGLGDILDSDAPLPDPPAHPDHHSPSDFNSISAGLIQEILPSIRFEDLLLGEGEIDHRPIADGCAVCLYGFDASEEVRLLSNCRHLFHRCCLDRWIELDQQTCPLCRKSLVPDEMLEAFDRRIWADAGFSDSDFADDFFPFASRSPFSLSASQSALPPIST
ncbi:hypothetical protein M5K25_007616 [Dendrobium thyrsiflorum]|uniref:RING-type domain-containing protein n=1 Tax=Dendrobium thyrsiflorum TaxID=117978 RepID=A0ABD0VEL9_DENTH